MADVVEGDEVRVVESADRTRFLLEAAQPLVVADERGRQHFDRDVAAEAAVDSAVDNTHAAGADSALDLVRADARACRELHPTPRYTRTTVRATLGAMPEGERGTDGTLPGVGAAADPKAEPAKIPPTPL